MLKRFIRTTVFCCLLAGLLSSCVIYISESEKYETTEELNSIYNDYFEKISREEISSTSRQTIYSAKTLQKNVTVISETTKSGFNSITCKTYSNYTALKYEEESIKSIKTDLSALYLNDDDYTVYSDNRLFFLIYNDANTNYEYLDYVRKVNSSAGNIIDKETVKNEETIYIIIKASTIGIRTESYMDAAKTVLHNSGITSHIKILLTDDSINLDDINNEAAAENLYKSKKYKNCYDFSYNCNSHNYKWSEEI